MMRPTVIATLLVSSLFIGSELPHLYPCRLPPKPAVSRKNRDDPGHRMQPETKIHITIFFIPGRLPSSQEQNPNHCGIAASCARIIPGELCSHTLYIPVFVPQMTGIETGQGHYGFSIVFVPPHSSAFESFGKAAAERLRRPGAYVIALLDE
jgi:hypothetical protein